MKKSLLFAVFSLWSVIGRTQWVSIPDSNFGKWLSSNYSQCIQGNSTVGWQMDTTCNEILQPVQIQCSSKNIHSLNGITYFKKLWRLYCGYNPLDSLPVLSDSLTLLDCVHAPLTYLPPLPVNLGALNLYGANITTWPSFPLALGDFSCMACSLTTLPSLPPNLRYLICSHNQLTILPSLPLQLVFLACGNNNISALPALPQSLRTLECGDNAIISLPPLPLSLEHLDCTYNDISTIPELPETLGTLKCWNNPHLTCLPSLKNVVSVYFYNTAVTCLPQYSNVGESLPSFDSLPLCGLVGNTTCDINWNISGRVYMNSDSNCVSGNNHLFQNSRIAINLFNNGVLLQQALTGYEGFYSFKVPSMGSYTIRPDSIYQNMVTCPDSGFYNITTSLNDSLFPHLNFGFDSALAAPSSTQTLLSLSSSFSLFPNPASNTITITVDESMLNSLPNGQAGTATVYDITGRKIVAAQLKTTNIKLETENFSSGIYFVTIENEKGRATKKLVIEK